MSPTLRTAARRYVGEATCAIGTLGVHLRRDGVQAGKPLHKEDAEIEELLRAVLGRLYEISSRLTPLPANKTVQVLGPDGPVRDAVEKMLRDEQAANH